MSFTRREIATILELEEAFLLTLERESIVFADEGDGDAVYSARMLERARVAYSLVEELDVNLAGVAIILRMRDDLDQLHSKVRAIAAALHEREITP